MNFHTPEVIERTSGGLILDAPPFAVQLEHPIHTHPEHPIHTSAQL
jgi:hypothetical protein